MCVCVASLFIIALISDRTTLLRRRPLPNFDDNNTPLNRRTNSWIFIISLLRLLLLICVFNLLQLSLDFITLHQHGYKSLAHTLHTAAATPLGPPISQSRQGPRPPPLPVFCCETFVLKLRKVNRWEWRQQNRIQTRCSPAPIIGYREQGERASRKHHQRNYNFCKHNLPNRNNSLFN